MKNLKKIPFLLILMLCIGTASQAQLRPEEMPIIVNNTGYDIYTTDGTPPAPPPGMKLYYLYDKDGDGEYDGLSASHPKRSSIGMRILPFGCSALVRIEVRKEIQSGRRYLYVQEEVGDSVSTDVIKLDK